MRQTAEVFQYIENLFFLHSFQHINGIIIIRIGVCVCVCVCVCARARLQCRLRCIKFCFGNKMTLKYIEK